MQPEALGHDRIEELRLFLASVFAVSPDAPFLHPKLMEWKYFTPVEGWPEPRSWVIRDAGRIAAHCGIWPLWYEHKGELIRAQHLIDWAASRSVAGAGAWIYMALARQQRLTLTVGGSSEARPVLPKIGFRESGLQRVWARPLRPFAQVLRRSGTPAWKRAALLARNSLWARHPLSDTTGWEAVPVNDPGDEPGRTAPDCTALARPAGWYRFVAQCPAVRVSFYRVMRRGLPCGFLAMARVGFQARLIDWNVHPAGPESWRAVAALAVRLAADGRDAHELLTAASIPGIAEALAANGFRARAEKPVFLHDREKLLAGTPPLQVHMADADAFFLYSNNDPYLT